MMSTFPSQAIERRSFFHSNVCRLCSFAKDKVLPIFDTSGSKFDAKIEECLPNMNVAPSDGKPQQICLECITKLNICYEFLRLCIRSDSYFESCIRAFKLKEIPELLVLHRNRQPHPRGKTTSTPSVQQCALGLKQTEQNIQNEMSRESSASSSEQHPTDGPIDLSKINQPLSGSIQDLVVVVQLKYKDGAQETGSQPEVPSDYEGLELPSNHQTEAIISNKTLEQAVLVRQDNLDEAQQDSTSLRERHVDQPSSYFRFDDETKEYECTLCDKKFERRSRLSSHLTRHTGIKPHGCEKCDKSFGTIWELNIHARIHRRDIVCVQCDKAFTTNSKLERHYRVHTGEKPFGCSYCGKNFGDKRNLDNHIRTHTGAKPYSCSVCDKTFSVHSHMIEHLNVHKNAASFHCFTCNKVFRWRSNYRKHLKTHC